MCRLKKLAVRNVTEGCLEPLGGTEVVYNWHPFIIGTHGLGKGNLVQICLEDVV